MIDEADLIRAAGDGDTRAFDRLVAHYEQRVWAICLRMCGESEDARDATQDTFLTLFRSLKTFRGESQLGTWLHRVAINASYDVLRKRSRRKDTPVDELPDIASEEPRPDEIAVRSHRIAYIQKTLLKLSEEHRAVVVLHDIQGLEYPEIARILELPLGTVKSRLHRARADLARMLGHLKEAEPRHESRPLT